jgi:hypothetical protein
VSVYRLEENTLDIKIKRKEKNLDLIIYLFIYYLKDIEVKRESVGLEPFDQVEPVIFFLLKYTNTLKVLLRLKLRYYR